MEPSVVIRKIIVVHDDWGRVLGKMIGATEARVASYKKLVGQSYKEGDRESVELFKEIQHDEERWLKRLRWEKSCWNADVWGWYFMSPEGPPPGFRWT